MPLGYVGCLILHGSDVWWLDDIDESVNLIPYVYMQHVQIIILVWIISNASLVRDDNTIMAKFFINSIQFDFYIQILYIFSRCASCSSLNESFILQMIYTLVRIWESLIWSKIDKELNRKSIMKFDSFEWKFWVP